MPFISFSCLIALVRTSNTMLNKSEGEYLVLFLISKEKFSLLTGEYDVCCGLVTYGLYCMAVSSLYTHLLRVFIIKEC